MIHQNLLQSSKTKVKLRRNITFQQVCDSKHMNRTTQGQIKTGQVTVSRSQCPDLLTLRICGWTEVN